MEKSRIAFVTGGSGAIGAQICRILAADGFWVAVGYNSDRAGAESVAKEIKAAGGTSFAVKCDVSDYGSIECAKAETEKAYGTVDTLVNCAGVSAYRLLSDETAASIADTLNVDLLGTLYACRVFSPCMVSCGYGRIVNISSVWGVCGASMETVYSAAKSGVIGFTKALAAELAPCGVTVNAVSPGFIDTPMNNRFSEAEREAIRNEIPACRFGTPDDVAALVRFLASREAGYVTGQNIAVTGGFKNV